MTNLFLTVLGTSVSMSLVIAALLLLAPFLNKRYAAKWKYLIWIFLALRLLIPFAGTDGMPVASILRQMKTLSASESEKAPADVLPTGTAPGWVNVQIPAQMTVPISVQAQKRTASVTLLDLAAMLWMLGSLAFLSVHLVSYLLYRRKLASKGIAIEDSQILHQLSDLKQELQIKRNVPVIEYPETGSPMMIGFIRPSLILPKASYRPEELFFILKHELVHLKRKDIYFKLLFVAANAVHWFNPLVWAMQKEAAVDMELACDERVTQGTDYAVRKAYTETLLAMLHKQCAKKTVLSTQFYGGKQIMKKRFKNILVKTRKKNGISILICAVVLTASLGTLVGCSVAKERKDVSVQDRKENASGLDSDMELDEAKNVSGQAASGNEEASGQATNENISGQPEDPNKAISGNENASGQPGSSNKAISGNENASGQLGNGNKNKNVSTLGGNEYGRIAGRWVIDFDKTDATIWGSGISYGNKMELSATGEFRYHIGIGVGGTGQCEAKNGMVTVEIEPYESHSSESEILRLNYMDSNGEERIHMDWHGEDVYWKRVEPLSDADRQEISDTVYKFSDEYFARNAAGIQKFLAKTYKGDISVYDYEGNGNAGDVTVEDLSIPEEQAVADGKYVVSLKFSDSSPRDNKDPDLFLTLTMTRQEDGWKIEFYGLEL